jgi:hypothetical protein
VVISSRCSGLQIVAGARSHGGRIRSAYLGHFLQNKSACEHSVQLQWQ